MTEKQLISKIEFTVKQIKSATNLEVKKIRVRELEDLSDTLVTFVCRGIN